MVSISPARIIFAPIRRQRAVGVDGVDGRECDNGSLNTTYDEKHKISLYDPERAEKEHIDRNIKYHIEFFRSGLNTIIKMWLADGCKESPEEMVEVLRSEYRGR